MKWSGVPWLRRWLMWAAVSLRTLTVKRTLDTSNGDVKESKYYVRIAIIGVLVAGWAIVSAVLALDVPDLLRSDRDLPWIGDRLWWAEILRALLTIAAGTAILTVVFGAALRSRRALSCGALAGVAVGFLGLPMIASLVGAIGYYVLQWLVARVTSPA